MDPLDILPLASAQFRARLDAVGPDQWHLATPCDDWDVRALVNHVVGADAMAVALLGGSTHAEGVAVLEGDQLGDDPKAAFERGAVAQQQAFSEPGALGRVCHHAVGDLSGAQLLGLRISDLALHAWDLARALGTDDTVDPVVMEEVWRTIEPIAPFLGQSGYFGQGSCGTLPEDASVTAKVLDATGRRT